MRPQRIMHAARIVLSFIHSPFPQSLGLSASWAGRDARTRPLARNLSISKRCLSVQACLVSVNLPSRVGSVPPGQKLRAHERHRGCSPHIDAPKPQPVGSADVVRPSLRRERELEPLLFENAARPRGSLRRPGRQKRVTASRPRARDPRAIRRSRRAPSRPAPCRGVGEFESEAPGRRPPTRGGGAPASRAPRIGPEEPRASRRSRPRASFPPREATISPCSEAADTRPGGRTLDAKRSSPTGVSIVPAALVRLTAL